MRQNLFHPKQWGMLIMTISIGAMPLFPTSAWAQHPVPHPPQTSTPTPDILQQTGSLQPTQAGHKFTGKAGQTVTIALSSDEFDTFLSLLDPSGAEIAANDDFARSLNSAIVITLPRDGTYTALARSYSGQGGDYTLNIRPATDYEQAYMQGINAYLENHLREAIAAFTTAIELDPNQPIAYLDRGDMHYERGNIAAMIADYEQAAKLYEQQGDETNAQELREQINDLQSMSEETLESEETPESEEAPAAEKSDIPAQLTPQVFRH